METQQPNFAESWSLDFDRDGTEDIAVIRDVDGVELVRSRHFWRPEAHDPIPPTLVAVRLMAAAPKLYRALEYLLEQTVEMDLKHGIPLSEGEEDARTQARAALTATCAANPECHKRFRVDVVTRTRDCYHVRATDADEARRNWWRGERVDTRAGSLQHDVLSAEEVLP